MSDLLIFNRHDSLLCVLSNEAEGACPFWEAPFKEILNNGSYFSFTTLGNHPDSVHIAPENQVAFLDKDGNFRLFVMREPEYIDGVNGPQIRMICESAVLELKEEVIRDIRPQNVSLNLALTRALNGTRWRVGQTADLGINTTNYYYTSVIEAIFKIIDVWGGEFRDRITIEGNKITGRYIDILARRGADTGKLWDIDKDIINISKKIVSYPITALYGRGASLEVEDDEGNHTGGYTRKISFADIEAKISNGDYFDKPRGQEWVGDPEALSIYGRLNEDGTKRHRFGIFEDGNIEDPAELLKATWRKLQELKLPVVHYEIDVLLLEEQTGYEHEKVRLGDTSIVLVRSFTSPIEVEERVVVFEYDVANPDDSGIVELGNHIDLYSDANKLNDLEKEINDKSNLWDKGGGPITDDRFPNITPSKPINFVAEGNFQTIMLTWDYDAASYLSSYELYASQIQGFTPDQSNLIWRGKMSGHNFIAETNQQWYFRVRAVNTHGVAGPFTDEIMAQTVRIISDDIHFGPDIAEELRELSKTADILADGTIYADMIRQDVYDQIQADSKQYTDAEITATEVSLMSELANKAGFDYVDGKIYLVNEELFNKVDNGVYQNKILQIDNSLDGLSLRAQNVEANVSELTGEVGNALSQIAAVDIKANGISTSVNELRSDFNNLEIGGRNLLKNSDFRNTTTSSVTDKHQNLYPVGWGGYNSGIPNPTTSYHAHLDSDTFGEPVIEYNESDGNKNWKAVSPAVNIKENGEYTVSFDAYVTGGTAKLNSGLHHVKNGGETPNFGDRLDMIIADTGGTWKRMSGRVSIDDADFSKPIRLYIYGYNFPSDGILFIKRVKLEKGNKATDWTPAPEDIESRVSSAETLIDQTAYDLTLKASTQEVNSLTGRMTSAESSIRLLSDDIELKVDRDGIIGAINVQPGDVKIHTRLLDVGDFTNLIDNGDFEDDHVGQLPSGWINENSNTTIQVVDQTSWSGNNGSSKCLGLWASDVRNVDAQQERIIKVQEGDELYFELDYRFNNLIGPGSLSYGVRTYDLKKQHLSWTTVAYATTKTYAWTKLNGSYKVPAGVGYIRLRVSFTNNGETTNRAWVDNLVVRRKNNAALIVDGSITANLMAANSITAQNGALANASITRAKLQDAIIGTAQIDDLAVTAAKIASINADKINAGAIRSIDIYGSQFRSSDGLTQLDIVGGNVRLRQNNGRYVHLSPDGLYGYNAGGDVRFQADRLLVTSAALGTSNSNVYLAPDSNNEARVVNVNSIPSDGAAENYSYRPIRALGYRFGPGLHGYIGVDTDREVRITSLGLRLDDGTVVYRALRAAGIYADHISINNTATGANLYARPAPDGELRVTRVDTTDDYRPVRASGFLGTYIDRSSHATGSHMYVRPAGDPGEVRITVRGTTDTWRPLRASGFYGNHLSINGTTDGVHVYLRPASNGEVQATVTGTTNTYVPVRASSFPTGSMASYKEDIKEWTDSALDIINRSTIYQYRLKREVESGNYRLRQGLVIGEGYQVADELIDGDGVEQYLMNSINMKAIQELDKRTLGHSDEISWLKTENQLLKNEIIILKNKVKQLEDKVV